MQILAVTCMRNEGPYCLEWIAHHRAAGFDEFLIFTHDCDDGTDALLDLIPGVTHVPFCPEAGKSPQWSAMRLADRHPLMKDADWAMFFDCDEYLCLQSPLASVQDLIAFVPQSTDAIALQWRLFGASGWVDWEDAPTLERFTRAAPQNFSLPAGHFFKTLFRPEKFQKLGVHRPKNSAKYRANWSLCGVQPAPDFFVQQDNRINLFTLVSQKPMAWLNHYSVRSVTEFMIKRERGLPNRKTKDIHLGYWAERNFNVQEEHSIKPMLRKTRDVLHKLQQPKPVQTLLETALSVHRLSFEHTMRKRDSVMLFLHLTLLNSSAPPDPSRIQTHLKRLQNAID